MSAFQWGLVGAGASLVGTLFGAFGAKKVTKYNNAIAQAQADIARINAKTMELGYQQRLFAAEGEYQRETMRAGQAKASQRVALAANGIAMGVGSAAELQASTDIVKQINVNRLESNAVAEAWGYKAKKTDFENQALLAEAKKQSASRVFANTLLGGAAQTAFSLASARLYDTLGTVEPKKEAAADSVLKVDAISSAQPRNLTVDAISGAQMSNKLGYAPTASPVHVLNKYSPFYGVR